MSETNDSQDTADDSQETDTDTDQHTPAADADYDPIDPPRETTPGRGQGEGTWLEEYAAEKLEAWGYYTEMRVKLLALEADIVACRETLQNDPDDFLVVQCKDWERQPIGKQVIIRLCLLAFIARAMPVLCHTSRLTQPAWELAQAFDVRLLNLLDLKYDQLPPLTKYRPPSGTKPHRREKHASDFRTPMPTVLWGPRQSPTDLEGPVFGNIRDPPCYVSDRTGHTDYVSAHKVDYTFHER